MKVLTEFKVLKLDIFHSSMTPIILSLDQQIIMVKPSISLKQEVSLEVGEKMDLYDMYLRFQETKKPRVSPSWTI